MSTVDMNIVVANIKACRRVLKGLRVERVGRQEGGTCGNVWVNGKIRHVDSSLTEKLEYLIPLTH